MRIAIIDDVREDADRLEEYLRRYQEESGIPCECTRYPSAVAFLSGSQPAFDLVIMDIDMPGLNGVDAAKRLRESGDNVVLMFVTNMPQYALAGYAVDAVDYVLKPVAYADFALKLCNPSRMSFETGSLPPVTKEKEPEPAPSEEPAPSQEPSADGVTFPSDDGATTLTFFSDGTYRFFFESYGVEDLGSYTYEGGTLTVVNSNGLEMTADGDPMALHYVTSVSDQLTGDFTIPAADLAG